MGTDPPPPRTEALLFRTVGKVPPRLAREIVAGVSRVLPLPCQLLHGAEDLAVAPVPARDQVDADRLLADLEVSATGPTSVLVGLTSHDIGNPIFTHFFGRARHGGRAVLVSVARLTPTFYGLPDDFEGTVRRAVLEVVHEFGHVAGLRHCPDNACLMHLAHTVEALDLRGTAFCASCLAQLPRPLRPRA